MLLRLAIVFVLLGIVGGLLAGCATDGLGPGDLANACDVLGANADPQKPGGIKYNTYNNKKGRFAGKVLALDLATRNRLGHGLNCPGF